MAQQCLSAALPVAGVARYDGAAGVVKLTDTPTWGSALPADPVSTAISGGGVDFDMRSVTNVDLYPTGVGIRATYDGTTAPTATNGFAVESVEQWRTLPRTELAKFQFYIPLGVSLHVRYLWGSR